MASLREDGSHLKVSSDFPHIRGPEDDEMMIRSKPMKRIRVILALAPMVLFLTGCPGQPPPPQLAEALGALGAPAAAAGAQAPVNQPES